VARAAEPPGEAGPCIPNAEVPPYIGRDAETDQRLMDKFDQGGLAIIVGPASAGKTRLAYEAARRHAGGRLLLFPSDPQALKRLRDAARPKDRLANAVVWLDQINTYVTEGGLNGAILNFLCPEEVTDIILLGTLRREDYNALTAGTGLTPEIMQAARDVLDHAAIIHLSTELTDDERIRAEAQRADPRIAAALDQRNGAGFAPYLAAAPWALDRWLANAESPAGKLVTAAIDARLAGFQAPLTPSILKELHAVYVTSPNFDDALAWCLEPVRGASGCLIPEPGAAPAYRPFTYLLDYAQSHRMPPIPDDAWLVLQRHASPSDLYSLATAAERAGKTDVQNQATRRAKEIFDSRVQFIEKIGESRNAMDALKSRATDEAYQSGETHEKLARIGGYEEQYKVAEDYYKLAAERGHAEARRRLIRLLEEQGREAEAQDWRTGGTGQAPDGSSRTDPS
jgi:tetratricopeptide (TPR) repeat protein